MAEYFNSSTFGCFTCSLGLISLVMTFVLSISFAMSTPWRACFICPFCINLKNAFFDCFLFLADLLSLDWIASHYEMSSCSFPSFHRSSLLFRYSTCFLCFVLDDGFWSTSGGKTCSMWIANGFHFLLQLKIPVGQDTSEISDFPLGVCFFFHWSNFFYAWLRPHIMGVSFWVISIAISWRHWKNHCSKLSLP